MTLTAGGGSPVLHEAYAEEERGYRLSTLRARVSAGLYNRPEGGKN